MKIREYSIEFSCRSEKDNGSQTIRTNQFTGMRFSRGEEYLLTFINQMGAPISKGTVNSDGTMYIRRTDLPEELDKAMSPGEKVVHRIRIQGPLLGVEAAKETEIMEYYPEYKMRVKNEPESIPETGD